MPMHPDEIFNVRAFYPRITLKDLGRLYDHVEAHGGFYRCLLCEDLFDAFVWHCPICDHHWPLRRIDCWNCHRGRGRPSLKRWLAPEINLMPLGYRPVRTRPPLRVEGGRVVLDLPDIIERGQTDP
jgi:hypothetical protein